MPDKRMHRGPHPADDRLFAPSEWLRLEGAVRDLSWLLSRGYASRSSLKLVGDRYKLTERQRRAVSRCACADGALARRLGHQVSSSDLQDQSLLLDGYNLLTTIEAALAGGVILRGRDGCYRDMASVHGTYRKMEETLPAVHLVGSFTVRLRVARCLWLLDRPVSNSGRLKELILQVSGEQEWNHEVWLVPDPDVPLAEASEVIVSSDSGILDRCHKWLNLAREVIDARVSSAYVIDLSLEHSAARGPCGLT